MTHVESYHQFLDRNYGDEKWLVDAFWVRAETPEYALKGAYRRDLTAFRSRKDAEAMDSDDNLYLVSVEWHRMPNQRTLRPEDV